MSDTFIQPRPPNDGKAYDCQCARCGSTLTFQDCEECGGEGVHFEDGFGDDGFDDTTTCGICGGSATFPVCISGEEWCRANPAPGRDKHEPHTPEWFEDPRSHPDTTRGGRTP